MDGGSCFGTTDKFIKEFISSTEVCDADDFRLMGLIVAASKKTNV
jgi:hypothetical protein